MDLSRILTKNKIVISLEANSPQTAITTLAMHMVEQGFRTDVAKIVDLCLEREKLIPTSVGKGVALPHCKINDIDSMDIVMGISRLGIPWQSPDELPVRIVLLIVSPLCFSGPHVEAMSWICENLRNSERLARLLDSENPEQALSVLDFKCGQGKTGIQ
ncbi:MAG: hypothetical protein CVV64_07915 [Candidatus Wallbacteria bacterium HGW-Wallbacteria-1]|jgi:PTS system fructose-specific IIC component|uniref:PTS EIIA type-2 domain-containing protein n=1 Tax=Candidatus Wallbacteria bacterium HGW-Wallbacteria-1 TaxID=2013854 RepID=A0A2N1PR26_9BACT|nr:MAG: hypothetical protein CVV64_07915 [Candidatus Wallbacteria bacterium HGW-Wallbacteria-1]